MRPWGMASAPSSTVGSADVLLRTTEVANICRRFGVSRLDLFGSASVGVARPDSDLDFLVEFRNRQTAGYAAAYFGLLEELEALFGRRVDLVVASGITNPYFRESVERTKTLLYAA